MVAGAGLLVATAVLRPAAAQTPPPAPSSSSEPPKVTKIAVDAGPATGGSTVQITGTGFNAATAVTFGGVPAPSFNIRPPPDGTHAVVVEAVAPAHADGKVTVTVTTPAGTSPAVAAATFTYRAAHGRWATIPARQRFSHTATLLPGGKVLVAGGCVEPEPSGYCDKATASAELYDPVRKTWSNTADMTDARIGHTATLLVDGKVLVTGGCSVFGCQRECSTPGCDASAPDPSESSAEVYDPAAGTWAATEPLQFIQHLATATLLPAGPPGLCGPNCGKVLVAGAGAPVGGQPLPTDAAQLYDPASRTWTPTAVTEYPRQAASAILLGNGKVLVAGALSGNAGGGAAAPGELFDPATGTWAPTGNAEPNAGFSETLTLLPDNRVLAVTPGTDNTHGGELYDPTALPDPTNPAVRGGTWASVRPLTDQRTANAATLLKDGTVLVAGGGDNPPLATAELYHPKTATWTSAATMAGGRGLQPLRPILRPAFTATRLNDGTVLILGASYRTDTIRTYFPGGFSVNKLASTDAYGPSAELYTPASDHHSIVTPLAVALTAGATILLLALAAIVLRRRRQPPDAAAPAPGDAPPA